MATWRCWSTASGHAAADTATAAGGVQKFEQTDLEILGVAFPKALEIDLFIQFSGIGREPVADEWPQMVGTPASTFIPLFARGGKRQPAHRENCLNDQT